MQVQLMGMQELAKLIGNVGRARAEFDVNVQLAAIQVIGYSIVDRNITPANQLLDVIGAHLKAPLVAFLEMFGNMAWSKQEKRVVFFDVARHTGQPALEWTEAYAAKVAAYTWYKAKKEVQPASVFDTTAEFDRLIDRAAKLSKKGVEIKDRTLLDKMVETFNRHNAEAYLARITALPTAEDVQSAGASAEKLAELQEKFGGVPTPVRKTA